MIPTQPADQTPRPAPTGGPTWISLLLSNRGPATPDATIKAARALLDLPEHRTTPILRELAREYLRPKHHGADPGVRASDPETSRAAARRVAGRARPGGSVHRILYAYEITRRSVAIGSQIVDELPADMRTEAREKIPNDRGLTAREAEGRAGVRAAHKRTSELLSEGLLGVAAWVDPHGVSVDLIRDGSRVLEITEAGRVELARLDAEEAARGE